jgi:hypothetical protein
MERADIPEFARKTAFVGGNESLAVEVFATGVKPSFVAGLAMRTHRFEP